jgi:hypothetical protein
MRTRKWKKRKKKTLERSNNYCFQREACTPRRIRAGLPTEASNQTN